MSHPPIPPNCPYFKDHWFLWPRRYDESEFSDLDEPDGRKVHVKDRPIIAAVARCEWLDIAEKLCYAAGARPSSDPIWAKFSEAHDHADAWAEWGKGENP